MNKTYRIIGVMSGTSLDGLDIALCSFVKNTDKWDYYIDKAKTYDFSDEWRKRLSEAEILSGLQLIKLHNDFGILSGNYINDFISGDITGIDFIATHGHTVFHQPSHGITLQIGNGAYIAAKTGITAICDFRNLDVALGGQGAPLVPIGDKLLFPEYDYCLNLGGFANISFDRETKRVAFDICPVNIILNRLASQIGHPYDRDGIIGKSGAINHNFLLELNNINYYNIIGPKSLGKEWVIKEFIPICDKYKITPEDKIRTIYEHISIQIEHAIKNEKKSQILVTGGGTHNKFLMQIIQKRVKHNFVIPNEKIIDYKEALIFAFLGLLRYLEIPNCLKSSTNALKDNIGGIIYKM